jgi:hypothetical protein
MDRDRVAVHPDVYVASVCDASHAVQLVFVPACQKFAGESKNALFPGGPLEKQRTHRAAQSPLRVIIGAMRQGIAQVWPEISTLAREIGCGRNPTKFCRKTCQFSASTVENRVVNQCLSRGFEQILPLSHITLPIRLVSLSRRELVCIAESAT